MRANTVHKFTSTRVHVTCARTHAAQQTTRLIPLLPRSTFSFFFQSILPSPLQPCSFFKEPTLLLHRLLRSLARSRDLGARSFLLVFLSHLSFSFFLFHRKSSDGAAGDAKRKREPDASKGGKSSGKGSSKQWTGKIKGGKKAAFEAKEKEIAHNHKEQKELKLKRKAESNPNFSAVQEAKVRTHCCRGAPPQALIGAPGPCTVFLFLFFPSL